MNDKKDSLKHLNPLQYEVTQNEATEAPFQNLYWDNKSPGVYLDVVSNEPLFLSLDKYDSGSGWPSFTKPIDENLISHQEDFKLGMKRIEIKAAKSKSHLGHVFDDGPGPTGQRFCVNSASLRFIPVDKLEEEGLSEFLPYFKTQKSIKEAYFAGGCFWGVEYFFKKLPGVTKTQVGYMGDNEESANYEQVKTGSTLHAEVVKVTYDERQVSYNDLLSYFFRLHDPTTLNQQGNDIGPQYRSTVFSSSPKEIERFKELKIRLEKAKVFPSTITTTIEEGKTFYPAEDYHQDYLGKNPMGYNCHFLRPPLPFK